MTVQFILNELVRVRKGGEIQAERIVSFHCELTQWEALEPVSGQRSAINGKT